MPANPINMESAEVSAEVHFAQKLASNEKKIRDRAIKRLRKYLFARSSHGGLTESDVVKIWKGLHYCMWMQDKPLLQEELSAKISGLIQAFSAPEGALLFLKVFLETEAREWSGIDRFRLDKFMMMIRDMIHQSFTLLNNIGWPAQECRQFAEALALKVMLPGDPQLPDGLKLHLADIYVDELLKVPLDKMSSRKMVLLLRPFIDFLVYTSKSELASRVMQEVICKVLNTMSTVKRHAPPSGLVPQQDGDDSEGEEIDDEDIDEAVEIDEDNTDSDEMMDTEEIQNSFKVDADLLLFLLFKLAKDPKVKAKNRAMVYGLVKKYPEIYDNIMNTLASSPDGTLTAKDDGESEEVKFEDLALFGDDGPGGDQQQQQRKRKRRKNKNRETLEEEETKNNTHSENPEGIPPQTQSVEVSQKVNNKTKNKVDQIKNSSMTESSKPMKRKRGPEENGDTLNDMQRLKSRKISSEEPETQLIDTSTSLPGKSKKKKKKGKNSKEEGITPSSPTSPAPKLSNLNSPVSENKNSNAHGARNRSPCRSSADQFSSIVEKVVYPKRIPPVAKEKKEKGNKKKRVAGVQVSESNHLMSSSGSEYLTPLGRKPAESRSASPSSSSSISLAASLFSSAADRKKKSKKGRKSSSPSSSSASAADMGDSSKSGDSLAADGPGITGSNDGADECPCKYAKPSESDGSLTGVVQSVFSSIKEKYVDPLIPSATGSQSTENARSESSMDWSVVAGDSSAATMASKAISNASSCDDGDTDTLSGLSLTDPGPDRKKGKCCAQGDKTSMTPYGKKKVIFDLRKNRANKFQDYIKSLQRQPESPHLPEKSPSNSILKLGASPSCSETPAKKKSGKGGAKKSPKKKGKNQRDDSRSPSPSPKKSKAVRSRSNSNSKIS